MTEEKNKETMFVKYSGSANSIPSLGLTFKNGDTLMVPRKVGARLVGENIGFSEVPAPKDVPSETPDTSGHKRKK